MCMPARAGPRLTLRDSFPCRADDPIDQLDVGHTVEPGQHGEVGMLRVKAGQGVHFEELGLPGLVQEGVVSTWKCR